MSPIMTSAIALKALRRNKLRTALTTLGMIIGVAAVIVMVAIGTRRADADRRPGQAAGTNMIVTISRATGVGGVWSGARGRRTTTLTIDDAEAIVREVPGIDYISPGVNTRAQVIAGSELEHADSRGRRRHAVDSRLADAVGCLLHAAGRRARRKVAVLGGRRASSCSAPVDPTGAIDPHRQSAVPSRRGPRA